MATLTKTKTLFLATLASLMISLSQGAQASVITIDFEGFSDLSPLPPGSQEDFFFLTDVGTGGVVTPHPFGAPPPVPSRGFGPGDQGSLPDLEIARVGGGLFELLAFEFFFYGGAPVTTTVTGFLGAAVVGVDAFAPFGPVAIGAPVPAVMPTALAGVSVDRLVFDMGGGFDEPHVLDNIVLDDLAAVPLPSTLLLFGLGLAGLVSGRRRV